ncbi:MAG: transcription antitermination factor NusB [Lactobacillus iners]|uniref:transcription antitermination factor NusB n=1 Tax=Lactobacillus iners TaxID=147802 RepID=UPI0022CE2121|nr:transcription antitermination factor NusB [Lactobacillus iners]MCT7669639.1 transcription antitermination factor NusB [Lactobacillus iners]MCT7779035.1 transcription antitermination factor NusB [Lactobacillus iners]MCT7847330.1 transcription antitermination factor NusB [Lactobacillus iners]MCZ9654889.1 transcription antitermination factor NusB [Lactobacillus iners]
MTQHDVRVIAMQALYLADQVHEHEDVDAIKKKTMDVLDIKEFPDYAYEILQGVMKEKSSIDANLAKYLKKGWTLERLNKIDLVILEVGLFEIQNSKVIKPVSALNEALNMCDEFSSVKSKGFINGILANFIDK